ncbi:RNA polymerase II mediator complex subunit Nut1 [Histoplasma capsulatum H143]|uniref:Mediator of RNA polymerase II transcription subunit 5 n=1 Tax=Ajellomyces capsulatus (strain H143) TaxID=544712 RepID=C6H7Y9_AJECH|nr:RNA polymerase II mediator complex subunit Nut1 [Histoplasma capsulatum H143]
MEGFKFAGSSSGQWKTFLRRCLSERSDAAEFGRFATVMLNRHSIPGRRLIDIILAARVVTNVPWDPLIPLYVDTLHRLGSIKLEDILESLLAHSTVSQKQASVQNGSATKTPLSTLMTDYCVIHNATIAATSGHAPKTITEAGNTFSALAQWILSLLSSNSSREPEGDPASSLTSSPDALAVFESLGILFAALVSTERSANALSAAGTKEWRNKLGQALSEYIPLCAGVSIPLRDRLEALQKDFNLYGHDGEKSLEDTMMENVNISALEFESNVLDGVIINSRAGPYIYVNALLVGRPLVDDNMVVNYLNNRYGGDRMALIEDLITAAFDVLSNGMYRNEPNRTMFIFRSFLVNKLPPFFAEMCTSAINPIPMELCITRALSRIDPNAFPSFSEMFAMQGNSILSDVRQEFLFACALHKLIPEASIERLLGENPMQTLPVGGQFRREDLVSQINSNPERAEQLINELESMEGNAGAIAAAITEPLCALLDAWKWGEEQGESQPVYDEFGSILLLILAFKHKYGLSHYDLGISNPDSFVLRLLNHGSSSQRLEDLDEKQKNNLGAWITALFIAEGISDDSMSSCSPQEFYFLVATLFSQSLAACETGKLEFETLKGGFEYLLEPFLLPSLVTALTWLGHHIWESESDLATSLKLLLALVKPSSISGEAQEIHRTVLLITAKPLEDQLKGVRTRHPSRNDIKPVLEALEPYHSFQRRSTARYGEVEGWAANPAGGGIVASIRNTFSSFVFWSTSPEISMTPPSYTHRQIVAGIRLVGAVRVLRGIIDELKLQAETGSGDLALDIAATLICAPLAESFAVERAAFHPVDPSKDSVPHCSILTLRDALSLERESIPKLVNSDTLRAELIVRLNRRVDALAAIPQMSQEVSNIDVGNIMQDINLEEESMGMTNQRHDQGGEQAGQQDQVADDAGDLNDMLDAAVAAAAGGDGAGNEQGIGMSGISGISMTMDSGIDASIDDVLNEADMGAGNPEFLDLDMDGMF